MQQPGILLIQMRIVNFPRWARSAVGCGIAQIMAMLFPVGNSRSIRRLARRHENGRE